MKILHITPYYIPAFRFGGPVFSVHYLCKNLVNMGVNLEVWTTNLGQEFQKIKEDTIDDVKVKYFPVFPKTNYAFSSSLFSYLNANLKNFDLVHINGIYQFHSFTGGFLSHKNRIPYILSPRGMFLKDMIRRKGFLKKKIYIKIFEERVINNAKMIHCTSFDEKEGVIEMGINPEKIFVIPNPVEFPETEEFQFKKNNNQILFLGRINWKKGLDILIPAFKNVLKEIPDAKLIIAGPDDGYLDRVKKWINEYKLNENIEITDEVKGENKIKLIMNSDISILPSYFENFGMSVVESLYYRTPVIISDKVALKDYIKKYNCGIVSKLNIDEISNSIIKLLKDEKLRIEMGKRGNFMVKEEFDSKKVAMKMKDTYEKILQKEGL